MGKTVKGRSIISIASFLLVVVFCIVANGSVPKLYESYKQKEIAQQAATQATHVIKKTKPVQQSTTAPAEEPTTDAPVEEDANVYEIPVEEEEAPVEEESTEDVDIDTSTDDDTSKTEEKSFFEKIIDFFTSIFEKLGSCKLVSIIKEWIAKLLAVFGVTL